MGSIPTNLVIVFLVITLSCIPISRLFQWWSPPSMFILMGGLSSLLSLPLFVKLVALAGYLPCSQSVIGMAMFFSPFLFSSSIDMVLALENDGVIANYMAFYMKKGEPYLLTPYGTAVCYWDGVVHFLLYWAMLYDFTNGNACFRSVSLYWFGSFFPSMIVLLVGVASGPFPVYSPILLNVIYVVLPVFYLCWLLSSTTHHKTKSVTFTVNNIGSVLRLLFGVFFVWAAAYSVVRGLIAVGTNREILNHYSAAVEQPITHPYAYPKVAMMVFMFYGIPFNVYALYCLLMNNKTLLLVDLSMVYAGLAANMQAGYLGPYLIRKPEDQLKFDDLTHWSVFWFSNLLMFIVPTLFALYCYNFYSADKPKTGNTVYTRSRTRLETQKRK